MDSNLTFLPFLFQIRNMNYAIIAAGEGSRLRQEGILIAKPLIQIGDNEPLLGRLLRIFCENKAEHIAVICNEQSPQVEHFLREQKSLLQKKNIQLHILVRSTPSSSHSLEALSQIIPQQPFILTTVDTVFYEQDFRMYRKAFEYEHAHGCHAFMGVTTFCDDEKPLYISLQENNLITAFTDEQPAGHYAISAGIYGLTPETIPVLHRCIQEGQSRMRNFQRSLITAGLCVKAYNLHEVFDIDHASDIAKAQQHNFKLEDARRVLILQREPLYSPGAVEKDVTLTQTLCGVLSCHHFDARIILSDEKLIADKHTLVLSMRRGSEALKELMSVQEKGILVVNSPDGVQLCGQRMQLHAEMKAFGLPLPEEGNREQVWLKNGDSWTTTPNDVVFCSTEADWLQAQTLFKERGVKHILQQEHIEGRLLKCYVVGKHFFYAYDTQNHTTYPFTQNHPQLKAQIIDFASTIGIEIFGVDIIINQEVHPFVIDFNDFPSFYPCREQAAIAMVQLINSKTTT